MTGKLFGCAVAMLAAGVVFVPAAAHGAGAGAVRITSDHWSAHDERGFGAFITAIGDSGCRTVNACLHDVANPFRASDPPGVHFRADCADLPYFLRFYYAWKRGLPFSYVQGVAPRTRARDVRYSPNGNRVVARHDVRTGADAMAVLNNLRDEISSATYRIHPQLETPENDFYSPAITRNAIRPGTVIYDPNGHLALVYRIGKDGRIRYIDAHPDNSLTRGFYDQRFVRARPGMGAGFKNWRPQTLVGAKTRPDGVLMGGQVVLARNADIAAFSLVQFLGTGPGLQDSAWKSATFTLNGQTMGWYDYVRARMAGGALSFEPVKEVRDMVQSNCADLGYRADAVKLALAAGLQNRPEPARLPANIYGTSGDWETFSTPSRDARLKTAFKELRDMVARFMDLWRAHDPRLAYHGTDLAGDMLAAYDRAAAACSITYTNSEGTPVHLSYEEARRRLFVLSFDPYQCVERRWGAHGAELESCSDGPVKQRWYAAEQGLRNQIDRTYAARMDFTLAELEAKGPGTGPADPPDTDTRAWLVRARPKTAMPPLPLTEARAPTRPDRFCPAVQAPHGVTGTTQKAPACRASAFHISAVRP